MRIPNYKDTNCLRNNNTFYRFFNLPNKEFMSTLDKKTVRQMVRAEIAKMSEEQKSALSIAIFDKISHLEQVENASTVALFVSLGDEPTSASAIENLSQSKRIVVPRIEGDEMEFYDISEGLQRGAFGIMEPVATTPIEPSEIDVMIVPGVAFTRNGARCGRGKGFYDKYLSRRGFRAYTIGVCYPCQVVEELPTEKHDKVLDKVVF
jgi:5-formyltetrahydrofolate cyclo-ligase